MSTTSLFTDHPAWRKEPGQDPTRVVRSGKGIWLATWSTDGLQLDCLSGAEDQKPTAVQASADDLPAATPAQLSADLRRLGSVSRLTNPWLWDALSTAIMRQVIKAAHARKLYQTWCQAYGTAVDTPYGPHHLVPEPGTVLALSADGFEAVGAAFFREALQSAAEAYLANASQWAALTSGGLAAALVSIRRIGPWTAKAAAADFTGDFSVYPHSDLAVRTWVAAAAPTINWPAEKDFEAAWRNFAKTPAQLHALTMLTLARGNHAHHDPDRSDSLF
jgi:DNA-3-methyladenine glycosylase II